MAVADRLHKSLDEMADMPETEFALWLAYFEHRGIKI